MQFKLTRYDKRKIGCKIQNKANRNTLIYDLDIRISNKNFKPGLIKILKHVLQILKNMVKIIEQKWRIIAQKWKNLKKNQIELF